MRLALLLVVCAVAARAQPESTPASSAAADDPIRTLVGRLDLERYKSTIKGLTQFGDRRQGTDRNRAAIDWIEAKLKSYGCAEHRAAEIHLLTAARSLSRAGRPLRTSPDTAVGGGRYRGFRAPTGVNTDPERQTDAKLRALDAQASRARCARRGLLHQGR